MADPRTITAAAVILSVPTHMSLISIYYVVWITKKFFTITAVPEVWRLVTSFLLTSPKLGLIFDPYFLYTYGSQLETGSPQFSQPGDFFVYLIFQCVVILVSPALFISYCTCQKDTSHYLPVQSSLRRHLAVLRFLVLRKISSCIVQRPSFA